MKDNPEGPEDLTRERYTSTGLRTLELTGYHRSKLDLVEGLRHSSSGLGLLHENSVSEDCKDER